MPDPDEEQQSYTTGLSANLPNQVQVRFPTKICPLPLCDAPNPPPYWYIKTINIEDVGFPDYEGAIGYYVAHDSAIAMYDGTGSNPTNQTDIDAIAKQIATDFYKWRSFRFDRVYNGVIAPEMDALIDTMEVVITENDAHTRLTTAPFNGEPEEFSHYDSDCPYPDPVVYVPTATRHGNYLRLPKAKLREDRFSELYLCTSSYDDIFICCESQSSTSSSSTSHGCPTLECPDGCGPGVYASCDVQFTVSGVDQCEGVPNPSCVCLNGEYFLHHQSGCTWVFTGFDSSIVPACETTNHNFPPTAMLSRSGGTWTFEITDGVNVVTWTSTIYMCLPANVFTVDSALHCCTVPAPQAIPVAG